MAFPDSAHPALADAPDEAKLATYERRLFARWDFAADATKEGVAVASDDGQVCCALREWLRRPLHRRATLAA
nr:MULTISPECIES: hypothetical protein [unclassified Nannocystis]